MLKVPRRSQCPIEDRHKRNWDLAGFYLPAGVKTVVPYPSSCNSARTFLTMALGFSNGEIFLGAAGEEEEQASKPATGRSASIQPSSAEPARRGGARGSAAWSSGRRPQRSGLPMDCLSTPRPGLPLPDSEACSPLPETLTLAAAASGGGADAAEAFVAGSKNFFSSLATPGGLGCRGAWRPAA